MIWKSENDQKVEEDVNRPKKSVELNFKRYSKISENVLYDYLFDNQNIFINQDENVIINISEEITWGNFECETNYKIQENLIEKNEGIRKNILRYFHSNSFEISNIDINEILPKSVIDLESSNVPFNLNPKIYQKQSIKSNSYDSSEIPLDQEEINQEITNKLDSNVKNLVKGKNLYKNFIEKLKKVSDTIKSHKPDSSIFYQDIIFFKMPIVTSKVTKVTFKCKFCESTNHLSKNCTDFKEYSDEFCVFCLGPDHKLADCPLRKCLNCNKLGHLYFECETKRNIEKCTRCRNIGHVSDDCLINPSGIKKNILEKIVCIFCNKTGHLICPLKKDYLIINDYTDNCSVSEDDSEDTEIVSIDAKNFIQKEKYTRGCKELKNFCPKCAGEHEINKCDFNSSFSNGKKFEIMRSNFSNKFFLMAPSRLAKDKNFLDESFTSEEDDNDVQIKMKLGEVSKDNFSNINITEN